MDIETSVFAHFVTAWLERRAARPRPATRRGSGRGAPARGAPRLP